VTSSIGSAKAPGRWRQANSCSDQIPDVCHRESRPSIVFDFETDLDHVAEAYTAMDERRAVKSLLKISQAS
jgi:hypothetical protein